MFNTLSMNYKFYQDLSMKTNQLKSVLHDFKNHFIILNRYLENKDFDSLSAYLNSIKNYGHVPDELINSNILTDHACLIGKEAHGKKVPSFNLS